MNFNSTIKCALQFVVNGKDLNLELLFNRNDAQLTIHNLMEMNNESSLGEATEDDDCETT